MEDDTDEESFASVMKKKLLETQSKALGKRKEPPVDSTVSTVKKIRVLRPAAQCKRRCKELNLPACVIGRPRSQDGSHVIVFEGTKSAPVDPKGKSLPKEITLLLSDLLRLGAVSVWICNPVAFPNDVDGLFECIYHFIESHCKCEDLHRPDLYNVYHHYASKRGPTVYYRYK